MFAVFLHAREWIEIVHNRDAQSAKDVFLHAREWIEIINVQT